MLALLRAMAAIKALSSVGLLYAEKSTSKAIVELSSTLSRSIIAAWRRRGQGHWLAFARLWASISTRTICPLARWRMYSPRIRRQPSSGPAIPSLINNSRATAVASIEPDKRRQSRDRDNRTGSFCQRQAVFQLENADRSHSSATLKLATSC